jgi:hypothetical protein
MLVERLTFDVRGRRSGEAAKGTHKRSLWAVPLDGMVSHLWLLLRPKLKTLLFCPNQTSMLP